MALPGLTRLSALLFFPLLFLFSCHPGSEKSPAEKNMAAPLKKTVPGFNEDSAYQYTGMQVAFGPRVPGTTAHARCADFLKGKMESLGMNVILQTAPVITYDGKKFTLKNIIASFRPEVNSRILLCAHWDTRPFADEDSIDPDKPFDAANDGASGVGVLLEVARQIRLTPPGTGIDFIFFDLEDYGQSHDNTSWCLGSQYWSKNPHKQGYFANYGILLDMIGADKAVFPKEANSVEMASSVVNKVWSAASNAGYSDYFSQEVVSFVGVDDHIYINKIALVPCIDIIHYDRSTMAFGDYHHTHRDNMSLISKNTLKAVGQTLLEVIYNEQ